MQVSLNSLHSARRSPPPLKKSVKSATPNIPEATDSIELSAGAKPGRVRSTGWRRHGRKAGLGLMAAMSLGSAVMGGASFAANRLPLCQDEGAFLSIQEGQLCSSRGHLEPEDLLGYSGDADLTYDEVANDLLKTMDLVNVGDGYSTEELQRLAGDQTVPEESRLAAQELLADPILMNSVDVATDHRVNRHITADDLTTFAEQEPDSGAFTFVELASQLTTRVDDVKAFDYFDSVGSTDDKFSQQDLEKVRQDPSAPEPFREVAEVFLDSQNLFNGFDVADASFSPNLWHDVSGRQELDGVISRDDLDQVRYSPTPEGGQQWTDSDHESLQRIAQGGELEADLFTAFRQTDRGNCVSTAVIKAAMDHYGGQILESFTPNDVGGYDVVMRDGYRLSLTGQELEAGATASHFAAEPNDTESYANLLFTSAGKRAQLEEHQGSVSFGQALLSLNDGEKATRFPNLLGLGDLVRPLKLSEVPGQDGVVVHGGGHAYYVDTVDGQTLGDRWGTATEFKGRTHINEGKSSKGAFVFGEA